MLLAMLHFFTAIPKRGRGTFFVLVFWGKSGVNILPISAVLCYNGSENGGGGTENEKLLAVCLMALVCWVCAGYAEETRVGDTVMFGQYEQDGNLDNGSEPIAWQVLDV